MSRIFELIGEEKARKLVRDCSNAFGIPVVLLDGRGQELFTCPPGAALTDPALEPLRVRDDLIGYVGAGRGEEESGILRFIGETLSSTAEMGYEIESLSEEVVRNYEEFSLLWKFSERLATVLDVDTICLALADEVMGLCPSKNVSVLLCGELAAGTLNASCPCESGDSESGAPAPAALLSPKVFVGADSRYVSAMLLRADRGLTGCVMRRKEALTVCDVTRDDRFEGFPFRVKSILIVPLVVEETAIGVLVANDKLNGEEFYSTDIKIVSGVASQAAISIRKALLFDEIRQMFFSTAEAFSLAIDAKDPYTYGHSKRVSEIAGRIANKARLAIETTGWVRLAALLHDIGKIGTPERILYKDGELDPDEAVRMKEHSLIGAKMLEHIRNMKEIAHWVRCHHERFDGSGYPFGLKGDDIPLPSRIIAIADSYDALTTDRPYRKALSKDEALERMRELAGTHFDPVLFCHFEQVMTES